MKTEQHIVGIIAKKCVQLKIERNIDAFLDFSPHVNLVVVEVYKNWGSDSSNKIFSGSSLIKNGWNSRNDSMSLMRILENLDALLLGLGFE